MSTEIVGFVGFTQQEDDILSPVEAATIVAYLRDIFSESALLDQTLASNLAQHIADYDNPHHDKSSATFIETIYEQLYVYYCDITIVADQMSYDDFKILATQLNFLELIRRLIIDRRVVSILTAANPANPPVTVDNRQVDPFASKQTMIAPASVISSNLDDFFKQLSQISSWSPVAGGSGLRQGANELTPLFYARQGLIPPVTKTDPFSDFLSMKNLDMSGCRKPPVIALRLGVGKQSYMGDIPVMALDFGTTVYTIYYSPGYQITKIGNSTGLDQNGFQIANANGQVWIEFSDSKITLVAFNGVNYVREDHVYGPSDIIGAPRTFDMLQPVGQRTQQINVIAVAVFDGAITTGLIEEQTQYL